MIDSAARLLQCAKSSTVADGQRATAGASERQQPLYDPSQAQRPEDVTYRVGCAHLMVTAPTVADSRLALLYEGDELLDGVAVDLVRVVEQRGVEVVQEQQAVEHKERDGS